MDLSILKLWRLISPSVFDVHRSIHAFEFSVLNILAETCVGINESSFLAFLFFQKQPPTRKHVQDALASKIFLCLDQHPLHFWKKFGALWKISSDPRCSHVDGTSDSPLRLHIPKLLEGMESQSVVFRGVRPVRNVEFVSQGHNWKWGYFFDRTKTWKDDPR